jgi:hypothetical protein
MANRVLVIAWDHPSRGAEERALEAFNEALGMFGRMQQEGRIENFEVALLEPNSDMAGFMLARGTAEQITAVRADDEFQRNTLNAQLSVDGIRHLEGSINEGVARMVGMFQEAIASVPQRT